MKVSGCIESSPVFEAPHRSRRTAVVNESKGRPSPNRGAGPDARAGLLDGRNRYRACLECDVEPSFAIDEGANPLEFVISKNLRRRHLNESQRSMVAARLANMRQGERTDLEPPANLPKVSQPEAADLLNVSERSLRDAKMVQEHAEPELIAAVDRGEIAVSQAAKAAKLEPEFQQKEQARDLSLENQTYDSMYPLTARVGGFMSDDRGRFDKVLAIAINPGAYEGEAIAALRKARKLVGKNPALAYPSSAPSQKSSDSTGYSFTAKVTSIAPFWLNIFLNMLSDDAYRLRLISKITCDFTQTPIAVDIRCDGSKNACAEFEACVQWLINYINSKARNPTT